MINCSHYPEIAVQNTGIDARYHSNFDEEELEHLQRVAAFEREARMNRSGFGDLCQSDLD